MAGVRVSARTFSAVLRWLGFAGAIAAQGCTFLLEVGRAQCDADPDCVKAGLGTKCTVGVCTGDIPECTGPECGIAGATTTEDTLIDCGPQACTTEERCFEGHCVDSEVATALQCEDTFETTPETITLRLTVRDFSSPAHPQGLVGMACGSADIYCERPVATVEDESNTGVIAIIVPHAFDGFIRLTSDDSMETLWYTSEPLVADEDKVLLVPNRTRPETSLITVAGLSQDPALGIIVLEAHDCEETPLGGVHFVSSKGSEDRFVIINMLPNAEESLTVYDPERKMAWAGFLNAEPGITLFSAHLGIDGPMLGRINVLVRELSITYVDFVRR